MNDLQKRLNMVIKTRCNTVGCDNCDLKFGGFDSQECSATDLDHRIMEIELAKFSQGASQ